MGSGVTADDDGKEFRDEFHGGPVEVRVFHTMPEFHFPGDAPGDAQVYIDGEWDERNNWTEEELRSAAAAFLKAADRVKELLKR